MVGIATTCAAVPPVGFDTRTGSRTGKEGGGGKNGFKKTMLHTNVKKINVLPNVTYLEYVSTAVEEQRQTPPNEHQAF